MKSAIHLAGALLLALFASTVSAYAQPAIVKVKIPFDFTASDMWMLAGEYTITLRDKFLILQTGSRKVLVLSYDDYAEAASGSKLVFSHYGNESFLHEVIGHNTASLVLPGKAEKEARRRAIEAKLPSSGVPTIVAAQ